MCLCLSLFTVSLVTFLWQYLCKDTYITILKKIFRYTQGLIDEQRNAKYTSKNNDPIRESSSDEDTVLISSKKEASTKLPAGFLFEEEISAQGHKFNISDVSMFVECGISAILYDQVVDRFRFSELETWNLMTRQSKGYQNLSTKLKIIWLLGLIWRYLILLPYRVVLGVYSFFLFTSLIFVVGCMPQNIQRSLAKYIIPFSFRIALGCVTTTLRFHNKKFKPTGCGICVANHTTPIDLVCMSCDNIYTYVGQRHGGFLGFLMSQVSTVVPCMWFERGDYRDRNLVRERMKEAVESETLKCPVLIFPEGTCINNTAVLMFRKGAFEVCDKVYPVAIKYDSAFAEPYWDRKSIGFLIYVFSILTSWAVVCDLYYMPPMERLVDESGEEFANRVKTAVANKVQLTSLQWDGDLKRTAVKAKWTQHQQAEIAKRIQNGELNNL